jgi:hypothetical protein
MTWNALVRTAFVDDEAQPEARAAMSNRPGPRHRIYVSRDAGGGALRWFGINISPHNITQFGGKSTFESRERSTAV